MLIDTHCHIHDRDTYDFAISRQQAQGNQQTAADFTPEQILARAHDAGVEQMVCVGTTHKDSLAARDFAAKHDDVLWSYGIHPEECETSAPEYTCDSAVAIGEVGLDYHSEGYNREKQIKLLEQMLELATKNNLPLIFHVRTSDAFDDFWPIVDNAGVKHAVIHSFSDSVKNLEQALNHDFYIGVNGLATFVNIYPEGLSPLSHIILETDAPFLSPVRGRVNEPAYIKEIAEWLAGKTGQTLSKIANQTTKNAKSLFHI